jgi:hypothetical protein
MVKIIYLQKNFKLINNNFYKFIKKFYFIFDKHKQRIVETN